jgi:hypothetical protein
MIMPSEPETIKPQEIEFEPKDMIKAFYLVVVAQGGVMMAPRGALNAIPDEKELFKVDYAPDVDAWVIIAVKERKRKILTRRKKLILPP